MTLSQAFKLKKKLIKELKTLEHRIINNNSYIKGETPTYDVKVLIKEYTNKKADLVILKKKIIQTSLPVYDKILTLSELKDTISTLRQLTCYEGKEESGYGINHNIIEYISVIDKLTRDTKIEETEKKIENIQEELDVFNFTTNLV